MSSLRTITGTLSVNTLEDGISYLIEPTVGTVKAGTSLSCTAAFYKQEGGGSKVALSCHATVFLRSGTTYTQKQQLSSAATSMSVSVSGITSAHDAVVIFIYSAKSISKTTYLAKVEIPVQTMGKNFYYAGVYAAGTTYTSNTYEAPYVKYNNNYWVLVAEGSVTESAPSSSNANWSLMTNDFKYIIAEAIFTDFARLGSWIFNDDYMFSNQGSGDYASFDAGGRFYGHGSSSNTYTPNLYINAETGKLVCNDITATGGTIGGLTIGGSSIYAPSGSFDQGSTGNMNYLVNSEFHLYGPAAGKAYLGYTGTNDTAEFGLAVSGSSTSERIMCKLESKRSMSYTTDRKIGIYLDIYNASVTTATFSQASDSGATAIYIKRGHVTGLRRRVRYVTGTATGSTDDSIVHCHNTSNMNYTLPTDSENGQEIWILPYLGNNVVVKPGGKDKLWRGGTDVTSSGITCSNRYYHIFLYCAYNSTWVFSSMSV